MTEEVSEAEVTRALSAAFGVDMPPAGRSHAAGAAFEAAGFSPEEARHGVELMESGSFLGFEDAATTLMTERAFSPTAPTALRSTVSEASITEAAAGLAGTITDGQAPKGKGGNQ